MDILLRIKQAVIVEGKYDQIKLASLVDALIIPTDGFSIFTDDEGMTLIRRLAANQGVVILTDSDAAGFMIRHHIGGALPKEQVLHAYIPDMPGKERRKEHPSKEGKLGVEGVPPAVIIDALRRAGVEFDEVPVSGSTSGGRPITHADLYEDGLMGAPGSRERRKAFLRHLSLPEHLSTHMLLQVLGRLMTYNQYKEVIEEVAELSQK